MCLVDDMHDRALLVMGSLMRYYRTNLIPQERRRLVNPQQGEMYFQTIE